MRNTTKQDIVKAGKYNKDSVDVPANAGVNACVKLPYNEQKIIALIKHNNMISQADIAKKLKINESTVYRNIAKLKQRGILSREGADKNGYWKILNSDE